jgi:hypothetical protein
VRARLLALVAALLAALPALAAPQVSVMDCTPALEQRGLCVAGQVVELRVWEGAEWAANLNALAPDLNYQSTVPCTARRSVDEHGILFEAGPGDGTCTAELAGETIPNPQPLADAWRRWARHESRLDEVRRQREAAAEAARAAIPDPEPEAASERAPQ